eukprot:gene19823-26509_t
MATAYWTQFRSFVLSLFILCALSKAPSAKADISDYLVYEDKACRIMKGNALNMGDQEDFRVEEGSSQEKCFQYCATTSGCTGVEHNPTSQRCEIWTSPITDTAPVTGYDCYIRKPQMAVNIVFSATVIGQACKTKKNTGDVAIQGGGVLPCPLP